MFGLLTRWPGGWVWRCRGWAIGGIVDNGLKGGREMSERGKVSRNAFTLGGENDVATHEIKGNECVVDTFHDNEDFVSEGGCSRF
jgi:hypothetical protein